uniref:Serine protease n=1 Tax=Oryctes rhinoceros TaxID=72550 RepID=A0A5C0CAW9_ORYRH|nr:serine protease [Oryctes rhinoceros]
MFKFVALLAFVAFAAALPTYPVEEDPRIDINGDWRVVGGENAPVGGYPFIVSLRSAANSHFCGGSIITTTYILSAAHCLVGRSTGNTQVVAGTNTLNAGGVVRPSATLIVHANYNSQTIQNDIGLIVLANALPLTDLISTIALNTASTGAVDAVLVGWGRTVTGGPLPNNLQRLDTRTITHAACQQTWGNQVQPNQICALTVAGEGACNGDSGGPLIQTSNGAQIGIVSFGVACAQGFPDVYTRVSSFISWINSNMS